MTALTPEMFVTALYRCCLGREPEPEGLAAWADLIRQHNDPTLALAGIMDSDEFRARSGTKAGIVGRCAAIAAAAADALRRPLRIVDVGAQLLGLGSNPYDPLAQHVRLDIIGFDPLEARLDERAAVEGTNGLTLLPFAIADGASHTLYINNDDATSSLFPLNTAHNAAFSHLCGLHTIDTKTVQTRRLDDVLPPGAVDFLKLDVQGAELMVLDSGRQTLARTAVVHCEVEFAPIYAGQPLYPQIQTLLSGYGFELIDLLVPVRYGYVTPPGQSAQDRLLWADAIFFRVTEDSETLRAQSLIAASVYEKPTLAAHLLSAATIKSNESVGALGNILPP